MVGNGEAEGVEVGEKNRGKMDGRERERGKSRGGRGREAGGEKREEEGEEVKVAARGEGSGGRGRSYVGVCATCYFILQGNFSESSTLFRFISGVGRPQFAPQKKKIGERNINHQEKRKEKCCTVTP